MGIWNPKRIIMIYLVTLQWNRIKAESTVNSEHSNEFDNSSENALTDINRFSDNIDKLLETISLTNSINDWKSKRGSRKFSSWAGKRSLEDNIDTPEKLSQWNNKKNFENDNYDKRAKFSSWAGKRSNEEIFDQDKRAKFSSWGGKRDALFNNDKRPKFSSWAGKRNMETDDLPIDDNEKRNNEEFFNNLGNDSKYDTFSSWNVKPSEDYLGNAKRTKFSSWGGKRGDFNNNKKTKFSSWNGKRNIPDIIDIVNNYSDQTKINKRVQFSSWGGKRSENQFKKSKFSSWAGKRSDLDSKIDNRFKQAFSSWADKRSFSTNTNNNNELSGQKQFFSVLQKKYPKDDLRRFNRYFNSWRGKRNGIHTDSNDTYSTLKLLQNIKDTIQKLNEQNLYTVLSKGTNNQIEKKSPFLLTWKWKPVFVQNNPNWKRRPAFSSWGGKRSSPDNLKKNTPFSAWGGKRELAEHIIEKRTATIKPIKKLNIVPKSIKSRKKIHKIYISSDAIKNGKWKSIVRSIRQDFYPWAGKRSST